MGTMKTDTEADIIIDFSSTSDSTWSDTTSVVSFRDLPTS
jgi:hypothetical protein